MYEWSKESESETLIECCLRTTSFAHMMINILIMSLNQEFIQFNNNNHNKYNVPCAFYPRVSNIYLKNSQTLIMYTLTVNSLNPFFWYSFSFYSQISNSNCSNCDPSMNK